jgi:hypothetical protein
MCFQSYSYIIDPRPQQIRDWLLVRGGHRNNELCEGILILFLKE